MRQLATRRHDRREWCLIAALVLTLALASGCGGGGDSSGSNPEPSSGTLQVGVLMPLSVWEDLGWRQVLTWAAEEINAAGPVAGKSLELVFADTAAEGLVPAAERLAGDPEILAVIGPGSSEAMESVAPRFLREKKVLISPAATSEDIFRTYGGKKYLWRTVEADTAQLEAMIGLAQDGAAQTAALVAGADVYGQTFFNWFGFLAVEAGLTPVGTARFRGDEAACETFVAEALESQPDVLFAAALTPETIACIRRHTRAVSPATRVIFSDGAFLPSELALLGDEAEGLEGVAPVADPFADFDAAYRARFGAEPTPFAANAWDALLLAAYGLARSGGVGGEALANALIEVVDGRGAAVGWDRAGIAAALAAIHGGTLPNISGASGPLDYDAEFHTDPTVTYYGHWQVEDGAFVNRAVYTTGEARPDDTGAINQSGSAALRTSFSDPKAGPDTERSDLWALVVAGSSGWSNYRHQADALAQYQLLRANGVPDDRIILVLEDDLSAAAQNPYAGVVQYQPEGENLYDPAPEVDYRLEDIDAADLLDILSGNTSTGLDPVIGSQAGDNIYVFLAGHGSRDGFFVDSGDALSVGDDGSLLEPKDLNATLMAMAGRYRQVLLAVESCHAGALGEALTAPNAILLAAANPYENSLAHNRRIEDGTWLADRFAFELWREVGADPTLSLVHLYEELYDRVNGSHVSIYNAANFDGEVSVTAASFLSYAGLPSL